MTSIVHDLRDTLTDKEKEIYVLLCENLTNKQIALEIDMPDRTVGWHLQNIYKKLSVESDGRADRQSARRRAILYSGTRIEQTVSFSDKNERIFSLEEIRSAAKKSALSREEIEDMVSFLEMNK